jgi:8-amino-7-oxononanoate synthase
VPNPQTNAVDNAQVIQNQTDVVHVDVAARIGGPSKPFSLIRDPGSLHPHDTLINIIRNHAQFQPLIPAYHCLPDNGSTQEVTLTYTEFDLRARAIAAHLQSQGLTGQRIMLAYPHGLDFITGFFGCLFAGCVAVPTFMPHRKRTLDRFRAIGDDAKAALVLSTRAGIAQLHSRSSRESSADEAGSAVPWLASDEIPDSLAQSWVMPDITPDTLAMMQYTSGSTNRPKGVMLSHANLAFNAADINRAFEVFSHSAEAGVCWLPTYHDMGLVGGILAPIIAGRAHVIMSPGAFLQNPISWLQAITRYRATISGGPNFAYDLCARKATQEQLATLDLSSWNLAYVGAEPIMPDTLERFAKTFAPCGFDPKAFYPCYGMAEATLMVTQSSRFSGAIIRPFDEDALAHGSAVVAKPDALRSRKLVSSGFPIQGVQVAVVDPQTHVECPDGTIGEVWVSGPTIGLGYWQNPAHSKSAFGARLVSPSDSRPSGAQYLRTSDLGFYADGELYITGRLDDLIIVRGVNHHPQDIESTARSSHPLLDSGTGAAFSIEDPTGPKVVLIHEVARLSTEDLTPVLDAVRAGVLDAHGLALSALLLVRMGTVPRTTSGKVQRKACKAAFVAQEIKPVASFALPEDQPSTQTIADAVAPDASVAFVLAVICQHAHTMSGVPISSLNAQTQLAGLGLDSLKRMELLAILEKTFAGHLPDSQIAQAQTLGDLAQAVQRHLVDRPKDGTLTREVPPQHYDIAQFPEYAQLKRQEAMLIGVAGQVPYFRVDQGNAPAPGMANIQGRQLVNFCVYDYLGMSAEPQVAQAATDAITRYGVSAGASRLVAGQKQVHVDLEESLAAFLGTKAAISFVSGHATNVSAIGHLLSPGDLIAHDMLAHNSIIQGAKLSGATVRAFAHNDWQALDAFLEHERHRYRRVLIAIEGVYSMDGDWPDLPKFIELKKKHKALLLVDEAHSLGTLGDTGRGIGELYNVNRADVDLWMGTLSKSLASCGGYIAGSAELVEYLRYTAPGFIYSVGLSPPVAAAALAALSVLANQPQRVARLRELSQLFLETAKSAGLDTGLASGSPVVPVIVGNSIKCLKLSQALFDRGINVQPILHPAVSEAAARLRFFITTNHSPEQIRQAVSATAQELARI